MREYKALLAVPISLFVVGTALVSQDTGAASSPSRPQASTPASHNSPLSLRALEAGRYERVRAPATNEIARLMRQQHVELLRLADGQVAVVDTSLLNTGAATAATADSVRITWTPRREARGYAVLRDGHLLARVPAGSKHFTDLSVRPGSAYRYTVTPTRLPARIHDHPVWSFNVTVPAVRPGESNADAAQRQAQATARAAAAAATTTMSWVTFIPQAKIDAPGTGCSYGSGYQFGGDNRSFDWTSSRYRTAAHATITWSTKAVVGNTAVGTTHVYKKSTGNLVTQATASKANMESYKLGSGSGYVNIRMVNHAKNPFCTFGAIDGAIQIEITQSGNWAIRSGSYRRMPNHEMYIYNGGNVTWLLQSTYQSVYCLIGPAACDTTNLTGFIGSYS